MGRETTQFKPGRSGNPAGRPAGRASAREFHAWLASGPTQDDDDGDGGRQDHSKGRSDD